MQNCLIAFLVNNTSVFFGLLSLFPISNWNASWISQWKNVKNLLLQCDINFPARYAGIRTNNAQGNRMEKKMGTRLALCFEDKIISLTNLIQDFLQAAISKSKKISEKLPFAPKVGGLYLHYFHSISTRPPKLASDSLKGWPWWPSNRNRRCPGCLWQGHLSLGLFFSKSMEP